MTVSKVKAVTTPIAIPLSCLEEAEICREQAREAVRLKRFKAALGLFSTAAALCRRAAGIQEADDTIKAMANDRISQIDMEISMYRELMRSMERPLAAHRRL